MTRVLDPQPETEAPVAPPPSAMSRETVRLVQQQVFSSDMEFRSHYDPAAADRPGATTDFLFATPLDEHHPTRVFDRLRWGGQFVFIAPDHRQVEGLAHVFARKGYLLDRPPAALRQPCRLLGVPIPLLGRRVFYFAARKMHLVLPGTYSDRFTYDVHLEKTAGPEHPFAVVKRVPDLESITERLAQRTGGADAELIRNRARRLHQTIFPVFLTREAAFLKILQRDLPDEDRRRVPACFGVQKDDRGMVQELKLNWMRKTDHTLSQLDFALQAADLLRKIHEQARVIHLDLRLDNFVITRHGVGFVDFGSAARVGENIAASPFLNHLFTEIMRTSQIQRMLDHFTGTGFVTSEVITRSRRQVDKAIDLFYLAVQIDQPHSNPYTAELVRYEPGSEESLRISKLTEQVLRPADPRKPQYSSAREVLEALEQLREQLGEN